MTRWQLVQSIVLRAVWQGTPTAALVAIGYVWVSWVVTAIVTSSAFYVPSGVNPVIFTVSMSLVIGLWGSLLGSVVSLVNGLAAALVTVVFFYPPRERWHYVVSMLFVTQTVTYFMLSALFNVLTANNRELVPHRMLGTGVALIAVAVLTVMHANIVTNRFRWTAKREQLETAKHVSSPTSVLDDFADIPASHSRTRG